MLEHGCDDQVKSRNETDVPGPDRAPVIGNLHFACILCTTHFLSYSSQINKLHNPTRYYCM